MRSKTAKRILDKTPQEVKDKVQDYANKLILYNVVKSVCGRKKCQEPIYEFGLCFKHYCISQEQTVL